ncbi:AsmA family protein [Ahrensia marina]|uniref:AsmA family protein n=1 Tax=Ahrensia marina TaxID=1514904 RepID=UPI0035D07CCF
MIRRILIGFAVLALGLGALVLALPSLMSSQMVREQVASQISELTGRAVTLRGDQALQVFPNLSVELSDVVIEGDLPGTENALIVTETLRGAVRPVALLFGRIELSSFEMTRPTIRFLRNDDGQSNWQLEGSNLVTALEPNRVAGAGLQLGQFRITDGTLQLIDEMRGIDETISGANLSLSWPTSSTRAEINGSAIWRGEVVEIGASLDQPAALAQPGSTSGVVLSIQGAPLRLQFDGTLSPGAAGESGLPWQASGSLALSTPSLRRAANWLGANVGPGSTFGAFRLDADMNLVGLSVDLTEAALSLDGNDAEGVLTLDLDGYGDSLADVIRPSIQGTLDFDRLDLTAYLDTVRPTTTAEAPGDWRFMPVPNVFASGVNIDVRFATREVLTSRMILGETAGSVLLSEDQMVLGIAESIAYGGAVRGSLSLAQADDAFAASLDLSADNLELTPLLAAVQDEPRLAGALTFQAMTSGEGQTVAQLLETLTGDARFEVANAVINGIDLNTLAESFADGSFDFSSFAFGGQTALETFSANVSARDGYLQARDVTMTAERVSATLGGQSEIANRTLTLSGATAITSSDETLVVPFDVRGTWTAPLILPDLRALDR